MGIDPRPRKLFIDGDWVEPALGRYFKTINPATEEVITEVAEAGAADVERAVKIARRAFEHGPWPRLAPSKRRGVLETMARLLAERVEDFALLETIDTGKPISQTRNRDLPFACEIFRYYAGWADKIYATALPPSPTGFGYTQREPVGVVAMITPWNSPLVLSLMKIAPALAAGNVVIHKPASWTPLTAFHFAQLASEAGLPEGVLNVITGPGHTVGRALVVHPGVDKISFTGETATGREIMRDGAETLKRVSFELGGKSPNIVFADAPDLDAAATFAARGFCVNQGQICWAGSRLFVEASIHDRLMEKLLVRVKEDWNIGDPLEPETQVGPLISRSHREQVQGYIDAGKKEGARLVLGGDRPDRKGYYLNPTVFDRATNQMRIAREEIFGPVLSVIPFSGFDEVIAQANDTCYGLAAGVWTTDLSKAHRAARLIKAGSVWINTYGALNIAAPFGGFKQSGFGREMGQEVLQLFTEVKTVWVELGENP